MIWLPTFEQVCLLHEKAIAATGGSPALRDPGLIESALFRARSAYGGVEAYPSLEAKAAAAGCGLIQNHGFIDGNKRTGVLCMLLILHHNGVQLRYTQRELIDLGLQIAQSQMDAEATALWIGQHKL